MVTSSLHLPRRRIRLTGPGVALILDLLCWAVIYGLCRLVLL